MLIAKYVFADAQIVNEYRFIPIEMGQLFSINKDNKKYKFQSLDFELELINNSIDIKHINKIIFYNGNSTLQFSKGFLLCGIGAGLTDGIGNTPPKEIIMNIGIYTIPLSIIGFTIGYFVPQKETYVISENEWRFIP